MLKLITLLLFILNTAFAGVELHPAVKEDFYKGNWAYFYTKYGDKPEQARISDVTIDDTLFTTNASQHCKSCPTEWSKGYKDNKSFIYAFTNFYESPDFNGAPYLFATTLDGKSAFINPKGEELIIPFLERSGYHIIKFPVIRKKEFTAIWHPLEKRFLFAKNPSFYFISSSEEGQPDARNINAKNQSLNYELNPQSTFFSADQKTQLKFEDFSDVIVRVEKIEKNGMKIKIRDLSCGRGKTNVIAGICIKTGFLLDYYDCGKETEAFIRNEDLILDNGEVPLLPKEVIDTNETVESFINLDQSDHLVFPDEIIEKIKNGTITEADLPLKYRVFGKGAATNNINVQVVDPLLIDSSDFTFKDCDPETGKLQ